MTGVTDIEITASVTGGTKGRRRGGVATTMIAVHRRRVVIIGMAESSVEATLRVLRCAECGGQVHLVKPWRLEDVLVKPLGRRG
jgi:hypothetical protein